MARIVFDEIVVGATSDSILSTKSDVSLMQDEVFWARGKVSVNEFRNFGSTRIKSAADWSQWWEKDVFFVYFRQSIEIGSPGSLFEI